MLVIDALVGDKGLLAMIQARQQYRSLEQSLADVRAENAELREQARRLREDPSAIEELARQELGLIKPGEKLFIVKDNFSLVTIGIVIISVLPMAIEYLKYRRERRGY